MTSTQDKASKVRLTVIDVDGILTSGKLLYGTNGIEYKAFHVHDGLGIKLLLHNQIDVAIITAKKSAIVTRRMQDLGVTHVYQGYSDKLPAYEDLKQKLNVTDAEICYIGDDLPDLPLIRRAGFGVTVPNAIRLAQEHADWITQRKGGQGAVRELCEYILQAQGLLSTTLKRYIEG